MNPALGLRAALAAVAPALAAFVVSCGDTAGDVVVPRTHDAGARSPGLPEASASPNDAGHAASAVPSPVCARDCGVASPAGTACSTGSDCPAAASICDVTRGVCVGCRNSRDCSDSAAFCHPTRHVCTECLSATDCDGSRICTASGTCARPCTTAEDCKSDNGGVCDVAAGVCVECRTNSDCKDGKNPPCINGTCAASE